MSLESYAHKAAKSVVVGWLREAAAHPLPAPMLPDVACCMGLSWRVNRDGPGYGIWEEYPVLSSGVGIDPTWDEVGFYDETFRDFPDDRPPTYEELKAIGRTPVAILDVAVQHKGSIVIGIEIFHKHRCPQQKIDTLDSLGLSQLIQLPAAWVLGQVGVPPVVLDEFYRLPLVRPSAEQRQEACLWLEKLARESVAA